MFFITIEPGLGTAEGSNASECVGEVSSGGIRFAFIPVSLGRICVDCIRNGFFCGVPVLVSAFIKFRKVLEFVCISAPYRCQVHHLRVPVFFIVRIPGCAPESDSDLLSIVMLLSAVIPCLFALNGDLLLLERVDDVIAVLRDIKTCRRSFCYDVFVFVSVLIISRQSRNGISAAVPRYLRPVERIFYSFTVILSLQLLLQCKGQSFIVNMARVAGDPCLGSLRCSQQFVDNNVVLRETVAFKPRIDPVIASWRRSKTAVCKILRRKQDVYDSVFPLIQLDCFFSAVDHARVERCIGDFVA